MPCFPPFLINSGSKRMPQTALRVISDIVQCRGTSSLPPRKMELREWNRLCCMGRSKNRRLRSGDYVQSFWCCWIHLEYQLNKQPALSRVFRAETCKTLAEERYWFLAARPHPSNVMKLLLTLKRQLLCRNFIVRCLDGAERPFSFRKNHRMGHCVPQRTKFCCSALEWKSSLII